MALPGMNVSVRELTGFLCRSGSLDSRAGVGRLVEGTRLHQRLQRNEGDGYQAEVPLSGDFDICGTVFTLSGRADGIFDEGDGFTVDEIKTTTLPLRFVEESDYPAYEAQVECYAYLFAAARGLSQIRTRLTFCHLESENVIYFYHDHKTEDLREKVVALLTEYKKWALLASGHEKELLSSTKDLCFPFHGFREGQSEMINAAYHAIRKGERLFVQAPTGIGKTVSALYPAFRAIGEGKGRRIFYLTAKTVTRKAALDAVERLRKQGLRAKSIVLTAKEKACFCREAVRGCNSFLCTYSDGHYARVNACLWEMINSFDHFSPELIAMFARRYQVCPYELSLDLALWCDVIICDYNYLFDPRVYLRRFFGEEGKPGENILLVDEAHNLVDRAREMYSATLDSKPFASLSEKILEADPILYTPLRSLLRAFASLKKRCECNEDGCGFDLSHELYDAFGGSVSFFVSAGFEWLKVNGETPVTAEVLNAVTEANQYQKALSFADKSFVNYTDVRPDRITVRLLCLDPSKLLSEKMARVRAGVLFSATLTPLDYFADVLGGGKTAGKLELASPFPRENLFVGVMDKVSVRYADRENAFSEIAAILKTVVHAKRGHYLVFFPSYRFLREVGAAFVRLDRETKVIAQKPDMTEADREAFLRAFSETNEKASLLGFAVLGGLFSEGIDLVGDKLIGSVIVGTGIPQLSSERNVIAEYYEETREAGFAYAYRYPGMNKVLQAAGRVIRTDKDKGVVLLIDDRFATPEYARLFPKHWRGLHLIGTKEGLSRELSSFWQPDD